MDPFKAAVSRNLAQKTRRVLAVLTRREEKVLRMRFGIGEKTDHTLNEISRKFDLTRERIRQIEDVDPAGAFISCSGKISFESGYFRRALRYILY